jgi:hypothetical protein
MPWSIKLSYRFKGMPWSIKLSCWLRECLDRWRQNLDALKGKPSSYFQSIVLTTTSRLSKQTWTIRWLIRKIDQATLKCVFEWHLSRKALFQFLVVYCTQMGTDFVHAVNFILARRVSVVNFACRAFLSSCMQKVLLQGDRCTESWGSVFVFDFFFG